MRPSAAFLGGALGGAMGTIIGFIVYGSLIKEAVFWLAISLVIAPIGGGVWGVLIQRMALKANARKRRKP